MCQRGSAVTPALAMPLGLAHMLVNNCLATASQTVDQGLGQRGAGGCSFACYSASKFKVLWHQQGPDTGPVASVQATKRTPPGAPPPLLRNDQQRFTA